MRLEYISHSCFVLETEQIKLAFDPWITGSAYHGQWHLFPKPVDTTSVEKADIILISHGHEDHLHHESLKRIRKNAHIYFPFQWRDSVIKYLHNLQFKKVTEAVSFRTYNFKNIKITYLGYSLESVIVVECEGKVIVNINDALNSNHKTAVDFLLEKIKSRWPKIDFLLSGWSGAGYFPNKVHYKNKNDDLVARIREQYFADNFCRFTHFLQPKIAIPFAPGFVLLSKENRWINEIKFPRTVVSDYYREHFVNKTNIQFPILYPGDYLIDETVYKKSKYHDKNGDQEIYQNLNAEFSGEIAKANKITYVSEEKLKHMESKLKYRIDKNKSIYNPTVIQDSVFSIKLTDVRQHPYLNISFKNGKPEIRRSDKSSKRDRLILATKAKLLSENLRKAWGGDILTIGYGIAVEVFEERSLEKNLDIVCVRLISRYPRFKNDFMFHLPRVLKYFATNPSITSLWIMQKIKLRPYVNKYPFNERDHWITYNKCDLCKVCNIPELDFGKPKIIAAMPQL